MTKPIDPDDPQFRKYIRQISAGDYLFRQGDNGNTMLVILEGAVHLFHRDNHAERLVGTVRAGEMLGEKSIFLKSPYRRTFTAQASVQTVAMEFDSDSFKLLQAKIPDLLLTMVRIMSSRLDESNQMVFILQSTDEIERVIKYLHFFCLNHSLKVPEGAELALSATDIHLAVNVGEDKVEEILGELVGQRILVKKKNGYIISDENSLIDQISLIRERTAA